MDGAVASRSTAHGARRTLWGITDGSAGMESQVRGVLEALGMPYVIKRCVRRAPFTWLPTALYRGAHHQLTSDSDALNAPWPDAVISSGRRSAALALAVKAASGGRAKAIHLTDPRACRDRFDLIVAMEHDNVSGPNIITTRFALHSITPQALAAAAQSWAPRFAALPRPWVAVLLGGSTNRYTLSEPRMQQVIAQLQHALSTTPGSLLITPSRRTGEGNIALLREAFGSNPRVFLHTLNGENPYLGMLATADHVVVTDDSVNMMSEAHATGKPLHILPLPGQQDTRPAPLQFARLLVEDGTARMLATPLAVWHYAMVDEMQRVTEAIRQKLDRAF